MSEQWAIDVSLWQTKDYPLVAFGEHGLVLLIIRAGGSGARDPQLSAHVARAKAAGTPFLLYYWVDPTVPVEPQVKHAVSLVDETGAAGLCPDFEQWWADWSKWRKYQAKKLPKGDVPKVPPGKLNAHYKAFIEAIPARISVLGYSARWFVLAYCPGMTLWMENWGWWLAEYPDNKWWRPTWEQFEARLGYLRAQADAGKRPANIDGLPRANVVLWQVASNWVLPGAPGRLDVSIVLVSEQWLSGILTPRPRKWADLTEVERWEIVRRLARAGLLLDENDIPVGAP